MSEYAINRICFFFIVGVSVFTIKCESESESTSGPATVLEEPVEVEVPEASVFEGMSASEYARVRGMYYRAIAGPDDDLRDYLRNIEGAELGITLTAYERAHDNEWASLIIKEPEPFLAFALSFSNFSELTDMVENLFAFPEIRDMLADDPLYTQDDVMITVLGDKEADIQIGIADCMQQRPVILFGRPRTVGREITAHAWVFFKYHEYAHHLLGHVSCEARGDLSKEQEHKREYAADCFAGKILRHRFPDRWQSIVTGMWTKLDYKVRRGEGRESSTHPSYEARKDTLEKYGNAEFNSCGTDIEINIETLKRAHR